MANTHNSTDWQEPRFEPMTQSEMVDTFGGDGTQDMSLGIITDKATPKICEAILTGTVHDEVVIDY